MLVGNSDHTLELVLREFDAEVGFGIVKNDVTVGVCLSSE